MVARIECLITTRRVVCVCVCAEFFCFLFFLQTELVKSAGRQGRAGGLAAAAAGYIAVGFTYAELPQQTMTMTHFAKTTAG